MPVDLAVPVCQAVQRDKRLTKQKSKDLWNANVRDFVFGECWTVDGEASGVYMSNSPAEAKG